jgi:hypothetical protein
MSSTRIGSILALDPTTMPHQRRHPGVSSSIGSTGDGRATGADAAPRW